MLSAERYTEALGNALREAREGKELSQEGLSLKTGIHRNYIGGIERGQRQPTVGVILRLAAALETSPAELFSKAEAAAKRSA